ncbi:hypothetical protein K7X08_028909 [Anisodus acutangulus]|uniref:Uncharacterized protein n=1 Tax=Anisodus acutangulus TaxID=402998 RepID=A0A9Q1L447_9SOLA|nr:hypothetical protein K7X08_028909 [Anisodus acutangulus]
MFSFCWHFSTWRPIVEISLGGPFDRIWSCGSASPEVGNIVGRKFAESLAPLEVMREDYEGSSIFSDY